MKTRANKEIMRPRSAAHRCRLSALHIAALATCFPLATAAQLPAQQPTATAAPAPGSRFVGTVNSIAGSALTVTKDDGSRSTVTLAEGARVQQLPPGSTDIKSAQDATAADIASGDRVLVVAHPEAAGMVATRLVLMKSSAIAQTNATRQTDWQKRGSGGLVTAVDPAARTIAVSSGTRKFTIQTSQKTVFRRYASGSVRFEDAKIGTFADVAVGDQLRVRGSRDVDSGMIAADEIVAGSFRNLAGLITAVDQAAGTLTLKDLATNKSVVISVGPDADLRSLPPEMAAGFTARAHADSTGVAGRPPAASAQSGPRAQSGGSATAPGEAAGPTTHTHAAGDLSQAVLRMPKTTLASLKPGEAIMVVASGSATASRVSAITLLSGVEPLLAASPSGASSFSLSPWSMSGGGEGAGAGGA